MKRSAAKRMGLPLPCLLALRYLRGGRRDAYVRFLSVLATGGITLGVGALILVLSGLSGLQAFLRSDVLSRTPHLEIEVPPETDSEALGRRLSETVGVVSAQRTLRSRGWVLVAGDAISVEALGYEGSLPRSFQVVSDDLDDVLPAAADASSLAGDRPEEGLYIGDSLARRWALSVGDHIEIVSPKPTLTPFGPQPRVHQLRLTGLFRIGRTEDDEQRIAVPLDVARRLFGDSGTRFEIAAAGLDEALELAATVATVLPPGSTIQTWKDLNRALFFALKLEKMLMFAAVFLIVPVAAMSLITVLALLISSKRGEIGILQAMGAAPEALRRAFLILGGLLGTLGLTLGGTLGVGGAWVLDRYQLISPPGDIYFLEHIPFLIEAGDLFAIFGTTLVLIVASTSYAARRAAALRPVEALRN